VLAYLSTPERPVESVDDLAGVGRTHPGTALLMVLFLFSLIGIPATAGFAGKFLLFFNALGLSGTPGGAGSAEGRLRGLEQARLVRVLAVIAVVNAAVGAWYYLRVAAAMYLRDAVRPLPKARPAPVLGTIWVCALVTLGVGLYPTPLVEAVKR